MAFMNAPAPASSGGDFVPVLAYKANQGRLYLRDRVQDGAGNWGAVETEVTDARPAFAVDFGSLQVGWCLFVRGQAPQWAMAPYGQRVPERPPSPGLDEQGREAQYRQGFKVLCAGNAIGGLRELAGNSAALINGLNNLHSAFEAAPEAASGMLPLVKLMKVLPVKSGQSTNFEPVFEITGWVERLPLFGPRTVPAPAARVPVAVAPVVMPAPVPAYQGLTPMAPTAGVATVTAPAAPVAPARAPRAAAAPAAVAVADDEMPF